MQEVVKALVGPGAESDPAACGRAPSWLANAVWRWAKRWHAWTSRRMWLAGAIGAWAYSPGLYWPLGLWSMACLWRAIDKTACVTKAMRMAWMWGFGFHVAGLHWIATACWVDPAQWAWLSPFVFVGIPAVLALFPALAAGLVTWVLSWPLFHWRRHLWWLWPVVWMGIEWIQGHIFTGFPWNLSAYVWTGCWPMAQGVAWVGVYAWGAVTWLGIGAWCHPSHALKRWMAGLGVFGLVYGAGWWRLHTTSIQVHPHVWIRCVQPAIPQHIKMNPASYRDQWTHLMALSWADPVAQKVPTHKVPTHIVWPETAIPWVLTPTDLSSMSMHTPAHMLIGADFVDRHGVHVGLVASSPTGTLVPLYAKEHLVPGGEYIPFRSFWQRWFPPHWFQALTGDGTDFAPGKEQNRALMWPNTPPFRCLICYEGIFPNTIQAPAGHTRPQSRPQWILAISNDAWYSSWGQWQHFHNTRYRALEEGLPLVRVCNTGITAIIDPLGRVMHSISPNEPGILDGPLPQPLR